MDKTEFGTGFIHGCMEYPQLEGTSKDHQSCVPVGRISCFKKKPEKLKLWLFSGRIKPFLEAFRN